MAKTLVFDLGGVVLRWQPAHLLRSHLPQRLPDHAAAERLAEQFFESFRPGRDWAEFDRGVLAFETVARRISHRIGMPEAEVLAVMHGIPAHLQLRDDTVALLQELHTEGHRLVYLSNMPGPYVRHAQAQLNRLAIFEQGLYSSDVQLVKPEAAIYQAALTQFGLVAGDCIFFDDSSVNVIAARQQGWEARQFTDAAAAHVELLALGVLQGADHEAGPVSL